MRSLLLPCLVLCLAPAVALGVDSDGDGVDDLVDTCPEVGNPRLVMPPPGRTTVAGQLDDDGDGIGNACDCDLDQDGFCTLADFNLFLPDFVAGAPAPGRGTDMDGDGFVTLADFNLFLPGFVDGRPGPDCGEACERVQLGCDGPGCAPPPFTAACAEAATLLCRDRDVVAADDALADCLASRPVDDPGAGPVGSGLTFGGATLFRAFTRAARPLFEQAADGDPATVDRFREVLDLLGFEAAGRDPLMWTALRADQPEGVCVIPEGTLAGDDLVRALETELLPGLDRSLAELENLSAVLPTWVDGCELEDELGMPVSLEFDDSDVLLLRSTLHFLRGLVLLVGSYDLEVDLEDACRLVQGGIVGGIEQFLSEHPAFLSLLDEQDAALPAGADFQASLDLFEQALDAVLAEGDPQLDDFVSFSFELPEDEAKLRERLDRLQDAFLGPTLFPNLRICAEPLVDVGAFFGADPRALLPPFEGDEPRWDLAPDPEFAGVLPGFTQDDLVCAADTEEPMVLVGAGDGGPVDFDAVQAEILVMDLPLGANAGIESIEVLMDAWSLDFGQCQVAVDGAPVTPWVDAAPLFRSSPQAGGSVLLEGEISIVGDEDQCDVDVWVEARDRNGNDRFAFGSYGVVQSGLRVAFSPPGNNFPPIAGPLDVTLTIGSRDSAAIDPDLREVTFSSFDCATGSIDGNPVPLDGTIVDVSSFMTEDGNAADDVRTLTATLDFSALQFFGCQASLCVDPLGADDGFERRCAYYWFAP